MTYFRRFSRPRFVPPAPPTGLIFPSNGVAGSDISLQWTGANLLPRTTHTAIIRANYVQQTGYYAVFWHLPNAAASWPATMYCFGTHPFPSDGTVNSDGGATAGGSLGSDGTTHYYELAGFGASDYLASDPAPPAVSIVVTKGVWVTHARTCEIVNLSGTDYMRHTFWPDISNASAFIRQDKLLSSLDSPSSPRFCLGGSPWTGDGSQNGETPSGTFRGIRLFNAALSITDIATEAAAIGTAGGNNVAVSGAGQAAVWYINDNPTPTDVTDKSAAGHSPSWANANRPTLYAP